MAAQPNPETHAKPRAPLPDPRSALFRKEHPEFEAARAKVREEQSGLGAEVDREAEDVPGYRTNNLAAIDAAETAALNARAAKDRRVPLAHQAKHPVDVQTNPASAEAMGVEAGAQTTVTQKTMPNPAIGSPVNLG